MKKLIPLLALLPLGFLASCTPPKPDVAYFKYNLPAKRPSNPNAVKVKVSTNKQMVYVMENQTPLLVMPVSVGTSRTPTPKGNFRIFHKDHTRRANTHGFAFKGEQVKGCYLKNKPAGWRFVGTPMPYWCEFKSGYGFHTSWLKDHPCTHGCIRMHENVAPKFFALVKKGTPVSIAYNQPEDATLGRNVPRPPDAGPLPDYTVQEKVSKKIFTKHKPVRFVN